jgi:hypothetical protein
MVRVVRSCCPTFTVEGTELARSGLPAPQSVLSEAPYAIEPGHLLFSPCTVRPCGSSGFVEEESNDGYIVEEDFR